MSKINYLSNALIGHITSREKQVSYVESRRVLMVLFLCSGTQEPKQKTKQIIYHIASKQATNYHPPTD